MSVSEQPEPVSDGAGPEPGGSNNATEGSTPPSAAAVPEQSPVDLTAELPATSQPFATSGEDDELSDTVEPGAPSEAESGVGVESDVEGQASEGQAEVETKPEAEKDPGHDGEAAPKPEPVAPISKLSWAGVVFGLVLLYFLFTFADVWLASRTEYESPPVGDDRVRAAVVLGAAQYNGEPSPVLRARLDEAADLYEVGEVDYIVVTGGGQAADVTTEAKTGYDYLRETSGIPDERLLLEVQGASTYQSLAATARFLNDEGVSDVVLVTDRYHAKRSILTAEEVGLVPVVSLTPQDPSFGRLVEESLGVSLGRVIGFRRLDRL